MKAVITRQGDVLDAVCKRHLGSEAHVPAVLAINPGLAGQGSVYEAGIMIRLPDVAPPRRGGDIRLWGRT